MNVDQAYHDDDGLADHIFKDLDEQRDQMERFASELVNSTDGSHSRPASIARAAAHQEKRKTEEAVTESKGRTKEAVARQIQVSKKQHADYRKHKIAWDMQPVSQSLESARQRADDAAEKGRMAWERGNARYRGPESRSTSRRDDRARECSPRAAQYSSVGDRSTDRDGNGEASATAIRPCSEDTRYTVPF